MCYATVLYPGPAEIPAHSIRFERQSEYATVFINENDSNRPQLCQNMDDVDQTDHGGKDEDPGNCSEDFILTNI